MNKPFLLLISCAGLAVVMTMTPARSEFKPIGDDGGGTAQDKKPATHSARVDAIKERMSKAEWTVTHSNDLACEFDGQCEALEMGDRHCGGPSRYLVVSNANPKYTEVKKAVEEFTRAEHELNIADPPLSCTDSPKLPSALCKSGKCR